MGQETSLRPGQQQMEALRALPAGRPLLLQYHWCWADKGADPRAISDTMSALRAGGARLLSVSPVEMLAIGAHEPQWSEIWLVVFPDAAGVAAHLASDVFTRLIQGASQLELVVASPPPPRMARILRLMNRLMPWLPAPRASDHLPEELLQGGINPTPEQLAFFQGQAQARPIHMFNLLKFHARARYADGDRNRSGRRAYEQGYGQTAMSCFLRLGGRIVMLGRYRFTLIGNAGQAAPGRWDEIAVIEYPHRQAFLHMISNPGYQTALEHRDAGLAQTQVWCASPAQEYCR